MKKLLLTVASAVVTLGLTAQTPYALPNAGFETWQSGKAQNWSGYGDMGLIIGAPSYTLFTTYFQDGAVKHSGSYSMRIENTFNALIGENLDGIAWLGSAGTSTVDMDIYGIPFNQNLNAFSVWARYTINATATSGIDTAVIFCQTSKWTSTGSVIIDDASILINSNVSAFQNFTQPVYNVTPGVPDTLWIIALSSWNAADTAHKNTSKLWIDDLTLTVATGITAPVLDLVDTRIAPNPASTEIRFTTSAKNIGGYFVIYNTLGQEVKRTKVTSALNNTLNVEELPAGLYLYQILNSTGDASANGKLIIQH